MKIRKRMLGLATLLSIALVVPLAYTSGLLDASKLPFVSSTAMLNQTGSDATVFVDPNKIIKDYLLDPGFQIGDKIQIHINISQATDLYTWNVNITWNPAILNFTGIIAYGDFLAQTTSPYGTSRIVNIANVNNETGTAVIAESILGEYPGISGKGTLVTVEFLIVGYGWTDLVIGTGGSLPTRLLNSTGVNTSSIATNGYFRNTLRGDVNGDGAVDILDVSGVSAHWYPGPPIGPLGYGCEADINDDGEVNIIDISIVSANWNRNIP